MARPTDKTKKQKADESVQEIKTYFQEEDPETLIMIDRITKLGYSYKNEGGVIMITLDEKKAKAEEVCDKVSEISNVVNKINDIVIDSGYKGSFGVRFGRSKEGGDTY